MMRLWCKVMMSQGEREHETPAWVLLSYLMTSWVPQWRWCLCCVMMMLMTLSWSPLAWVGVGQTWQVLAWHQPA
jgi:hypothetical protein